MRSGMKFGFITLTSALSFFLLGLIVFYKPPTGAITTVQYERCENCKIEEKQEKDFVGALRSDPTAAFTALLFIATVFLAGVTVLLYIEARNTGKEEVAAAKASALQAERSARAAEAAIESANLSSERQLRAYVFPDNVMMQVDTYFLVSAISNFKNTGQTPAYKTSLRGGIFVGSYPLLNETFPERPESIPISQGTLGAGMSIHSAVDMEELIDQNVFQMLKNQTAAIYFFGEIAYHDAFGKERFTRFCYIRTGDSTPGPMSVYRDFNEAN